MRTRNWLKEKRNENNLTQRELADKIGLSPFTIEQIEQGKRLGSAETWEKIENFFSEETDIKISYESEDLIEELKQDIAEFGEDHPCILVYKVIEDYIFFTNYDFITEEDPFNPDEELKKDDHYLETTFKYALEVFEAQNKIL